MNLADMGRKKKWLLRCGWGFVHISDSHPTVLGLFLRPQMVHRAAKGVLVAPVSSMSLPTLSLAQETPWRPVTEQLFKTQQSGLHLRADEEGPAG